MNLVLRTSTAPRRYYTGRAGVGWLSANPAEAFPYEALEGASRQADRFNVGSPLHGETFEVANAPAPAPTRPQAAHEAAIVAGAVAWTAFMRRGPFRTLKAEVATFADAINEATAMARVEGFAALIYAVDAAGRSTMVGHVDRSLAYRPVA